MALELSDKLSVANAMITHGGSFVAALGEALIKADSENTVRIRMAFPEYWKQYEEIARLRRERGLEAE